MSFMSLLKRATFVVLLMALSAGCVMAEQGSSDSTEYYQSFAGYKLPLRPVQKISKEEATALNTYCIASLRGGTMVRFVKILDGAVFFEHIYAYYPNGQLMRAEITNRDGAVRVHEFNTAGELKK